ncbi:MAG: hypothetical protein ACK4OI_21730, partial [Rhizobium oryzihabitans]
EGSFFVFKRRRHEPIRQALFIVAQSTGKPTGLFSVYAASRSSTRAFGTAFSALQQGGSRNMIRKPA